MRIGWGCLAATAACCLARLRRDFCMPCKSSSFITLASHKQSCSNCMRRDAINNNYIRQNCLGMHLMISLKNCLIKNRVWSLHINLITCTFVSVYNFSLAQNVYGRIFSDSSSGGVATHTFYQSHEGEKNITRILSFVKTLAMQNGSCEHTVAYAPLLTS